MGWLGIEAEVLSMAPKGAWGRDEAVEISEIAKYSYIDANVVNNTPYYYKLEQITEEGKSTFIGPIPATPHVALTRAPR